MRLNKYIAAAGVCSRRKADELIANGNVRINGAVMKEMGYDVADSDTVQVNGRTISAASKKVYVAVNKPLGYITSMDDDRSRATVAELVADIPERLFPGGQTGLQHHRSADNDQRRRPEHTPLPTRSASQVWKTYIATVSGVISDNRIARLRKGVDIGGFVTSPAKVRVIKQMPRHAVVEISIHEGKNRAKVRKMFAAVGNKVQELERVSIGDIRLGRLIAVTTASSPREEIEYLKSLWPRTALRSRIIFFR